VKLTSSNFAAAMGISPWQSRQKLWRVLTGREQRDPINDNMQWGIDNEHRAVAAVEAATGLLFTHTGSNQKHIERDVFGTTPDGLLGSTGLEVKCPQKVTEVVPAHYLPQVQGQMFIAGLDTVVFGQWTPDKSRVWMVPRNDEYIEAMLPLLQDFMECLRTDSQPKRRKKPVMPEVKTERIK